jgi:hypothetical protein
MSPFRTNASFYANVDVFQNKNMRWARVTGLGDLHTEVDQNFEILLPR